jgi:hypothetical protein
MQARPVSDSGDDSRLKVFLTTQLGGLAGCALAAAAFFAVALFLKAHHAGFWVIMGATVVYGVVILAIGSFTARRIIRKTGLLNNPAALRYRRRFMAAMATYVFALIVALGVHIRLHLTGPVAYVVAVLPALPLVAAIGVMGLYLREETDEVERSIKSESALWATGGLLAVATVWGFLEMFKLVPHVEVWWAFPVWCLFLTPAEILTRRRYR